MEEGGDSGIDARALARAREKLEVGQQQQGHQQQSTYKNKREKTVEKENVTPKFVDRKLAADYSKKDHQTSSHYAGQLSQQK